jgi:hypothetical protein
MYQKRTHRDLTRKLELKARSGRNRESGEEGEKGGASEHVANELKKPAGECWSLLAISSSLLYVFVQEYPPLASFPTFR